MEETNDIKAPEPQVESPTEAEATHELEPESNEPKSYEPAHEVGQEIPMSKESTPPNPEAEIPRNKRRKLGWGLRKVYDSNGNEYEGTIMGTLYNRDKKTGQLTRIVAKPTKKEKRAEQRAMARFLKAQQFKKTVSYDEETKQLIMRTES